MVRVSMVQPLAQILKRTGSVSLQLGWRVVELSSEEGYFCRQYRLLTPELPLDLVYRLPAPAGKAIAAALNVMENAYPD